MKPAENMLSEEYHSRILADIENICRTAGVPQTMLHRSAKEFCTGTELDWLTRFPFFRRQNKGLVLAGTHNPAPDLKCMAMAAALIRNYVDARVITVQALLDYHDSLGEMPEPTVLFIPNLYVESASKGPPAWKMQLLYDLLLQRFASNKLTVVYVENLKSFGSHYGQLFVQHLKSNYLVSE